MSILLISHKIFRSYINFYFLSTIANFLSNLHNFQLTIFPSISFTKTIIFYYTFLPFIHFMLPFFFHLLLSRTFSKNAPIVIHYHLLNSNVNLSSLIVPFNSLKPVLLIFNNFIFFVFFFTILLINLLALFLLLHFVFNFFPTSTPYLTSNLTQIFFIFKSFMINNFIIILNSSTFPLTSISLLFHCFFLFFLSAPQFSLFFFILFFPWLLIYFILQLSRNYLQREKKRDHRKRFLKFF